MDGCSECGCQGSSRREVLTVLAAAAVMAPAMAGMARAEAATAPAEGSGTWVKTVKVAELKDGAAASVVGHPFVVTRSGEEVMAVSTKCTHKGCTVKGTSSAGVETLTCPCHGGQFDLTGKNLQGPHRKGQKAAASLTPLARYAVRVTDGVVEVNPSSSVAADAKDAAVRVG